MTTLIHVAILVVLLTVMFIARKRHFAFATVALNVSFRKRMLRIVAFELVYLVLTSAILFCAVSLAHHHLG